LEISCASLSQDTLLLPQSYVSPLWRQLFHGNEVLSREFGLREYTRRWVPHLLDDAQKNHHHIGNRAAWIVAGTETHDFDRIPTGDESWFHYRYRPREMLTVSREKVTSFVRTEPAVQKVMITVFFTSTTPIVSEALLKGKKFNKDSFISTVLPELEKEK
jgi:hypothetical protein